MSTLKRRALDYTSRLLLLPQVRRIGRKSPRPQAGQSGEVESHPNQSGHGPQETEGNELPVELLLQIFDHVSATDIIRYRAVSTLALSRTLLRTNFEIISTLCRFASNFGRLSTIRLKCNTRLNCTSQGIKTTRPIPLWVFPPG